MTDRKEAVNNVTEGKLLPSFIMFMIPLMLSSLLMQSYAIADGLILGNAISQEALGSVSTCSSILDICTLIQIGLSGGCSIMVSHLQGARRYGELGSLITDIRRLIIILSLAVAAAAFFLAPQMLSLIHTPEALFEGAVTYLRINIAGIPFTALYALQSGVLRGMGDSRRPLGGIAVSSAVNIGLDLLCVIVLGYGITGAAIATVAAEMLSAAYLWARLEEKRRDLCGSAEPDGLSDEEDCPSEKSHVRECIDLSIPQMLQSVMTSAGNILLQNITNVLGASVVIGVTVAFKVDSLLLIPIFCMSIAVSVFTGQNTGAGKPARVRQTLVYSSIFAVGFSVLMAAVLWQFGYPMFSLFGLSDEAAGIGFRYVMICLPFYWVFGLQFVFHGYLNGKKHTGITAAASVAGLCGRVLLAYLGHRTFGADVLPAAEVLAWIIAVGTDTAFMLRLKKREK